MKAVVPLRASRLPARSRAGFQRVIYGCYLNKIGVARARRCCFAPAVRESLSVDADAALDWEPLREAKP